MNKVARCILCFPLLVDGCAAFVAQTPKLITGNHHSTFAPPQILTKRVSSLSEEDPSRDEDAYSAIRSKITSAEGAINR